MKGCGNFDHACQLRGYCVMKVCTEYKESERMAQIFHEIYERLAPDFVYATREESRVPWNALPESNKNLMIATCGMVRRRA